MATTTHPIVAVNWPRTVNGLIELARFVATSMKDNPNFPSPTPPIALFEAHIDELEAGQAAVLTRTKGTAAARNLELAQVRQDLRHLRAYVQRVADGQPSEALAIIESSGFTDKKVGSRSKNDLEVTQGPVPGSVHLVAKARARRASYEWQYTLDGKTWFSAPSTLGAVTDIAGLTPATRYGFRFRSLTKAGQGDWSDVVWFIVR